MSAEITKTKTNRSAIGKELAIINLVAVCAYLVTVKIDVFERFASWAKQYERWNLDELVPLLGVVIVTLCVLFYRRWRRLVREVRRREQGAADIVAAPARLDADRQLEALQATNERLQAQLEQRELAEVSLRRSEEQYRQLVEKAAEIIFTTDDRGRFTFVNQRGLQILRWREPDILGTHYLRAIRADYRDAARTFYEDQFRGRTSDSYFEFPVIAGDGSVVWLGQTVTLLQVDEGVIGFQAIARDLTGLKRQEDELRAAREYRDLFRLASDPILIIKPEGELVLDINDKACETYGLSREEFKGCSLRDLSRDPQVGDQHLRRLLAKGRYEFESLQLRADGMPIDFLVNASVIDYQGGRAILSIHRDITERKRQEDIRRSLEEQLRQSQKMEAAGQLAGGVAHDFNNLLAVISGYADMLGKRLSQDRNEKAARQVDQIKQAAERAGSLTRQLLAFSRKQVLQPKILDLNAVVGDTDKMLRRLIGEHIEICTNLEPKLGHVQADPGQIEQVLINLAVNARDAMPQGGKLTIQTSNVELDASYAERRRSVVTGPHIMIAVTDTGAGMPAAVRERIFEPFFTTKEKGRGTGLGLSTVYGIIKQSGGNIWVYSEEGKGTSFKIYLPRVDAAAAVREAKRPCVDSTGDETILLVEDEESLRKMTHEILETSGYHVLDAAHGNHALEVSAGYEGSIDLLVTDVVMPRMGGPELAKHLATVRPEMRVLFMSGYTDDAIVHHGVLDEGTPFLEKPFTPTALTCKIRELLSVAPVRPADTTSSVIPSQPAA